jgi:hypothetical protein
MPQGNDHGKNCPFADADADASGLSDRPAAACHKAGTGTWIGWLRHADVVGEQADCRGSGEN